MALPTGLRAFRHADFRRFFAAQLVAQIGSWMQTVAQSWLVLQLTDSPLKLGLIGTLQFGPILLFSIVSGALADRLPKRRLLIVTQTVLGCQALALAALVASGHVQYWHVAVLATGVGLANVLDSPARQSFVAEMVGRSDLSSAVSLNSASFNGARIVGPSIGGLLIAAFGVALAFVANGVGFAIAIAMMATLRTRGLPQPRSGAGVGEEILTGIRYVWRKPEMRLALGLCLMVSFCVFNFTVYVPLVVRTVLGLGAEGDAHHRLTSSVLNPIPSPATSALNSCGVISTGPFRSRPYFNCLRRMTSFLIEKGSIRMKAPAPSRSGSR